jgi:hypothetical protein
MFFGRDLVLYEHIHILLNSRQCSLCDGTNKLGLLLFSPVMSFGASSLVLFPLFLEVEGFSLELQDVLQ